MHKLFLQRYSDNGDDTTGLLFVDSAFFCHTIEDEARAIKVAGETRFPAGEYDLSIRDEITPLTKKYRNKYDWFDRHIEIIGIPNFKYVYIHIGNDDDDTDACLLLGNNINNNQIENGFLSYSTPAYERFYKQIYPLLKAGDRIKIIVRDEEFLQTNED